MLFDALAKVYDKPVPITEKSVEDFFRPFDLITAADAMLASTRDIPIPSMDTQYRVSGLSKMCEREEVLRHIHLVPKRERIDASLQKTFDFGNGFHSVVQNTWFGKWGWLEGDWICTNCGLKYLKQTRPKACAKCLKEDAFHYIELELENKKYFLTGHPDGILILDKHRYVQELKTCNSKIYEYVLNIIRAPLPAHLDQINLYMFLLGIRHGFIVYFNKDTSQWKKFDVVVDMDRVRKLIWKISATKQGIAKKTPPPRRECEKKTCTRAKACSVREICFK